MNLNLQIEQDPRVIELLFVPFLFLKLETELRLGSLAIGSGIRSISRSNSRATRFNRIDSFKQDLKILFFIFLIFFVSFLR